MMEMEAGVEETLGALREAKKNKMRAKSDLVTEDFSSLGNFPDQVRLHAIAFGLF